MSDELFEAYGRNELDAAGRAALRTLITSDAAARARFADHLLLRSALISCHRQQAGVPQERRRAPGRSSRLGRHPRHHGSGVGRFRAVALALTALAALLVVMIWPVAAPVASATGEGAAVLRGGTRLALRQPLSLRPGDEVTTTGTPVNVRFADGTTIELGDGSLQVDGWSSGKELRLLQGGLRADVTPQGTTPLRITGPRAEAVVLGTRFTMRGGSDWSSLAVDHGRVQYRRLADDAALELTAGQVAYVAPGIPFAVRSAGAPACLVTAGDARIDAGCDWRLVPDPATGTGQALEDPTHQAERVFFASAGSAPAAAHFTIFAEADTTYHLWIRARTLPSREPPFHTDSVFVIIDGAEWLVTGWNRDTGWEWFPRNYQHPPAFFNGWATRHAPGTYGWIAGPGDPDDVGVPDRLPLRFPRTGTYHLRLVPTSGPLRVDRIVLQPGSQPPE